MFLSDIGSTIQTQKDIPKSKKKAFKGVLYKISRV